MDKRKRKAILKKFSTAMRLIRGRNLYLNSGMWGLKYGYVEPKGRGLCPASAVVLIYASEEQRKYFNEDSVPNQLLADILGVSLNWATNFVRNYDRLCRNNPRKAKGVLAREAVKEACKQEEA